MRFRAISACTKCVLASLGSALFATDTRLKNDKAVTAKTAASRLLNCCIVPLIYCRYRGYVP